MPSLNVFNNDVAQASLAPPASVPEHYEELWWYSGSYLSDGNVSTNTPLIKKGDASGQLNASSATSACTLYTLNSSWNPSNLYAFEIALSNAAVAQTTTAALYDLTAGAIVSASQVSVTGQSMTIVRSGSFTLTPGHSYGITCWTSNNTYAQHVTDASLIIFS